MSLIPVLCDRCRVEGLAGQDPFADLADLLSFSPVPRRPHANGWDPEMQRGFIAALVVTGSPPRAARAIGKHAFGAQQLRKARGGSSFAAAWDAALDLARERELAGLKDSLTELAAEHDDERHRRRSAILPSPARAAEEGVRPEQVEGPRIRRPTDDDWLSDEARRDCLDQRVRIRERLTRARRLLLFFLEPSPAKRAAWEELVGPVDWARAATREAQADEPFADPADDGYDGYDINPHSFTHPDMILTAEAHLLPDFTGGPDPLAEIRAALVESAEAKADDGEADALP